MTGVNPLITTERRWPSATRERSNQHGGMSPARCLLLFALLSLSDGFDSQSRNMSSIVDVADDRTTTPSPPTSLVTAHRPVYCRAYCDRYGTLRPPQRCQTAGRRPVYCCGALHSRRCCHLADEAVSDLLPEQTSCVMHTWWYYQWRTIISLLSMFVVLLAFSACCYFCFGESDMHRSTLVWRQRRTRDSSSVTSGPMSRVSQVHSLHTCSERVSFQARVGSGLPPPPPPYATLPKDPPRYSELFRVPTLTAADNRAFVADGAGGERRRHAVTSAHDRIATDDVTGSDANEQVSGPAVDSRDGGGTRAGGDAMGVPTLLELSVRPADDGVTPLSTNRQAAANRRNSNTICNQTISPPTTELASG